MTHGRPRKQSPARSRGLGGHSGRTARPLTLKIVDDRSHCTWCGLRIPSAVLESRVGIRHDFPCLFPSRLKEDRPILQVHIGPMHDDSDRPCKDKYYDWLRREAREAAD